MEVIYSWLLMVAIGACFYLFTVVRKLIIWTFPSLKSKYDPEDDYDPENPRSNDRYSSSWQQQNALRQRTTPGQQSGSDFFTQPTRYPYAYQNQMYNSDPYPPPMQQHVQHPYHPNPQQSPQISEQRPLPTPAQYFSQETQQQQQMPQNTYYSNQSQQLPRPGITPQNTYVVNRIKSPLAQVSRLNVSRQGRYPFQFRVT
jgi:hypothetical protein